MSLTQCTICEIYIDTDEDPDCYLGDKSICDSCMINESVEEKIKEIIALGVSLKEVAIDIGVINPQLATELKESGEKIIKSATLMVTQDYA